jgi:hypothetical protein
MAAGDRKIKLLSLHIPSPAGSGVVQCEASWAYRVEDKAGQDSEVQTGNVTVDLGAPAAALAMTLAQIRTAALNKINASGAAVVPAHDSAS